MTGKSFPFSGSTMSRPSLRILLAQGNPQLSQQEIDEIIDKPLQKYSRILEAEETKESEEE